MTAFLQTSDGDLAITVGKFTLVDGADEKAQKISNRLELFAGEWFLDKREGTPYWESILDGSKNPNLEIIKRIFRRVILSVEGVADATVAATFDRSARRLDWSWVAFDEAGVRITGGVGRPFIVERS